MYCNWLPRWGLRNLLILSKINCHWRTDEGSERSRKKNNTAPRWFEKQEKILGAERGSWRSKKMETTVYHNISNISIFHKSLDLLISSILNNNNNNNINNNNNFGLLHLEIDVMKNQTLNTISAEKLLIRAFLLNYRIPGGCYSLGLSVGTF